MRNEINDIEKRKAVALKNLDKVKDNPIISASFIKFIKNLEEEKRLVSENNISEIRQENSIKNEELTFNKKIELGREKKELKRANNFNLPFILDEEKEINEYVNIFLKNGFSEHYEVNNYISQNNLWSKFKKIRSLNDHGVYKGIKGIQPKYYAIVCKRLSLTSGGGRPLDDVHIY